MGNLLSRHEISDIFLIFPRNQNLTFHANCLHLDTICMKCQILLSGKNKKKYHQIAAEFAHRVVKFKGRSRCFAVCLMWIGRKRLSASCYGDRM